ncbi:unnamed protein product [Schistocephalus solidus]|uniref:Sulfate_transp domain-containing protein n=1 Tax=Schistocephalus solidus TaxID=70667 RepID=A0A183SRY0_SCHSO|nr:unnamed protein product [Schistocephalus solidus]
MFNEVVGDVFVIAIVTFAISASLVKLYATEYGYDVLYNQELVALGLSNIFGSFFQCIASCGALARSAVVVSVGMVSQFYLHPNLNFQHHHHPLPHHHHPDHHHHQHINILIPTTTNTTTANMTITTNMNTNNTTTI